jgi:hypothetical protein
MEDISEYLDFRTYTSSYLACGYQGLLLQHLVAEMRHSGGVVRLAEFLLPELCRRLKRLGERVRGKVREEQ